MVTVSPQLREWAIGLLWFSVGGLAASGVAGWYVNLWPSRWVTLPLVVLASVCCLILTLADPPVRNPDDGRDDG